MHTQLRRLGIGDGLPSLGVHVLFWGATYVFFVLYFGREAGGYAGSLIFVALLMPVAMATTYFATGFLVPRYLLTGRYGLFTLYAVYALVGSVYLELVVLVGSFMLLAGYDLRDMNPAALDVFGMVVAFYVVVFLAVAANLAMRWHRLRSEHDDTERARLEAELALREAEMARLKAQMQPHFLFNTLNNLYGLTLERSDDAPEVVLRISEMLDYVLYRCDGPLVPLSAEVEHLRTYLDLERLRYGDRVDARMHVDGELPDGRIAPLLLTPFVENAFKHGAARTAGESWVDVRIRAAAGALHFEVENSRPASAVDEASVVDEASGPAASRQSASANGDPSRGSEPGIGLENVRRRLRLLYPDAHALEVEDLPERFVVRLRVPIHPIENAPQTAVPA